LYTHKDFQRCGVARSLYLHLENEARKQGIKRLYVEASFLAKPFFEKHNFKLVKENIVHKNGIEIINFTMEKSIASEAWKPREMPSATNNSVCVARRRSMDNDNW